MLTTFYKQRLGHNSGVSLDIICSGTSSVADANTSVKKNASMSVNRRQGMAKPCQGGVTVRLQLQELGKISYCGQKRNLL